MLWVHICAAKTFAWLACASTAALIDSRCAAGQLKEPLEQSTPFTPSDFKGSDVESSPEQAQKNDKLASAYNKIWQTGDPSAADEILADDYKQVCCGANQVSDMVFGMVVRGSFIRRSITAWSTAVMFWPDTTPLYEGVYVGGQARADSC